MSAGNHDEGQQQNMADSDGLIVSRLDSRSRQQLQCPILSWGEGGLGRDLSIVFPTASTGTWRHLYSTVL